MSSQCTILNHTLTRERNKKGMFQDGNVVQQSTSLSSMCIALGVTPSKGRGREERSLKISQIWMINKELKYPGDLKRLAQTFYYVSLIIFKTFKQVCLSKCQSKYAQAEEGRSYSRRTRFKSGIPQGLQMRGGRSLVRTEIIN